MSITLNADRQYPLVAVVDFTEPDFTVLAQAENAVEIPAGATIVGGSLIVDTAFDGGVGQTLTVAGGGVSTAAVDADATTGRTALTLTGTKSAATSYVTLAMGGALNGTAGAGRLEVQYVMGDRSNENQG